ncbi:glycosyltransferase family 2 protein [Lactiplantibacillus plantarum]|uniref:glycosyltransferase family 2 protein n=1 Tax=Lactiplantibacillus plantarum TaxID=1590 RepID=UPI003F5302D6
MISVIIPVYNRENTILKAVSSVLNQTYSNLEIIVVNDNSNDRTLEIVQGIKDTRLNIITLSKNVGANYARNIGIEKATGDFIAFQDSDDIWETNKLEVQYNAFIKTKSDIIFCQFTKYNNKNQIVDVFPKLNEGFIEYKDLIIKSKVSTQTILAKRSVFTKVLFDSTIPRFQDFDFTIRAGQEFKFYFIARSLVNVFQMNDSITSTDHRKLLEIHEILLKKYPDVAEKYPKFKIWLLSTIGYFKVEFREDSTDIFYNLYLLDKNRKNYFKYVMSRIGLLRILWFGFRK